MTNEDEQRVHLSVDVQKLESIQLLYPYVQRSQRAERSTRQHVCIVENLLATKWVLSNL
jgi:hypothetical protein